MHDENDKLNLHTHFFIFFAKNCINSHDENTPIVVQEYTVNREKSTCDSSSVVGITFVKSES